MREKLFNKEDYTKGMKGVVGHLREITKHMAILDMKTKEPSLWCAIKAIRMCVACAQSLIEKMEL